MGKLVNGIWTEDVAAIEAASADGRFERAESLLRNWVTPDGAPGPSGVGGFAAEPGRYHLYIAINCPWAHRTRLVRHLKGLDGIVSQSIALPRRTDQGWVFDNGSTDFRDHELGKAALHEVYAEADPTYSGRVTVPVLWDRHQGVIVSNESAEIVRMFNGAFDRCGATDLDLYPADLRAEIDALNAEIHANVNNGVYRAGFARTQGAYDEAVTAVFTTLDRLEARLARGRYLLGDRLTEADWRLFPTLVRFDVAYHGAFKCNIRRLADYPNLFGFARELYQMPGIAKTVDFEVYKRGYYSPSPARNPFGIVPKGPFVDFSAPHSRDGPRA